MTEALIELLERTNAARTEIRDLLDAQVREYVTALRQSPPIATELLSHLVALVALASPEHITHRALRHLERAKIRIPNAISFHRLMIERSEEGQIGLPAHDWLLDQKARAYKFCDIIGLSRPACDGQSGPFDEIEAVFPCVIKRVHSTGSRGVFLGLSPDTITYARNGKIYRLEELSAFVRERLQRRSPGFTNDNWIVEELILDSDGTLARDLKFYTFYGETLLVLEILRREGRAQHCIWSRDGLPLTNTGKYPADHWVGEGFKPEWLAQIEWVSAQIPTPFMRIDMLRGRDGLVFGEFTPRPGQFDQFTRDYDRKLGEAYLRARARLFEDLMNGKKFESFKSFAGTAASAEFVPGH